MKKKLNFKKRNKIPDASHEQLAVVNAVKDGYNVTVDSVFGSGKSTTILHIVQKTGLKCLVVTYSKYLKEESRKKAESLNLLDNMEIHSFHSLAVKYYNEKAFNDIGIVKRKLSFVKGKFPKFDVLIIDEIQDMTPELYEFVAYMMHDLPKNIQLVLIGDQYQCIFKFKRADNRYLTLGTQIFNTGREWKTCKLTTSFRVTNQIANFVNTQLVGYDRVKAVKNGPPVNYIIMNTFNQMNQIGDLVKNYLKKGYKPDDIFILSPTVKSRNSAFPLNILEQFIVNELKIPVVVQKNDADCKMGREEMVGKVVFCTYHAVKGLERKICIVVGFDINYFEYYAKNELREICPSTIYVACSRSLEHLSVIHDYRNDYLPFLRQDGLSKNENIKIMDLTRMSIKKDQQKTDIKTIVVTELVKYLPDKLVNELFDNISFDVIVDSNKKIKADTLINMDGLVENVSTFYGIVIPIIKQLQSNINEINDFFNMIRITLRDFYFQWGLEKVDKIEIDVSEDIWNYEDWMWLAVCFEMMHSKYINQFKQIKHYKWVNSKAIDEGIRRLNVWIDDNNLFEVDNTREFGGVIISGRPDSIDDINKILWEFKFVDDISKEHILQLVVYAWITGIDLNNWQLNIFNIKNGEILQIDKIVDIDKIVGQLIEHKFYRKDKLVDDNNFVDVAKKDSKRIILGPAGPGKPIPCI